MKYQIIRPCVLPQSRPWRRLFAAGGRRNSDAPRNVVPLPLGFEVTRDVKIRAVVAGGSPTFRSVLHLVDVMTLWFFFDRYKNEVEVDNGLTMKIVFIPLYETH